LNELNSKGRFERERQKLEKKTLGEIMVDPTGASSCSVEPGEERSLAEKSPATKTTLGGGRGTARWQRQDGWLRDLGLDLYSDERDTLGGGEEEKLLGNTRGVRGG